MKSARERRVEVVALEMAADIVDVEGSRAGRNQIGPRELVRRPGKRPAGAQHNTVAPVELAHEGRQRNGRAYAAAAIAAALEAVAGSEHQRIGFRHPLGKRSDVFGGNAACFRGGLRRPVAREAHVLLVAADMLLDERQVMGAQPLELDGEGEAEKHVGAGPGGEVEVRLLGDLRAQRIDHRQSTAAALGLANLPHQMQVRDGGVVAPEHIELSLGRQVGADTGSVAVSSQPGFAAHPAAERATKQLRGAELVKEPQRHAVEGQQAVGTAVAQRPFRS